MQGFAISYALKLGGKTGNWKDRVGTSPNERDVCRMGIESTGQE